jgi:hypothetical protein
MKSNKSEVRFIPNDCVVMVKSKAGRKTPVVGEGWQPEVAQFLQDIYPTGLEQGLQLSEMYQLAVTMGQDAMFDLLDNLEDDNFFMDDDDEGEDEL